MIAIEPTVRIRVRHGHELTRVRGDRPSRAERGRASLDQLICGAWRRLVEDGHAACLVCGEGDLSPLRGCTSCGSRLG